MKHIWLSIPTLSLILTILSVGAYKVNNSSNESSNNIVINFVLQNNTFGDFWLALFISAIVVCAGTYIYGALNKNESYKYISFLSIFFMLISIAIFIFFVM